jgi:hypothetical protein
VVQEEVREGLFADVDGEEFSEERGAGGEGAEGSGAEAGMAIEEEQEGGHALREGEGGPVVGFVRGEGAGVEGLGEEKGLAEAEGEAFAGDGVDGARGVADEGDVAAGDAAEAAEVGSVAVGFSRRTGMDWRISVRRTPGWRVMAEMQTSCGPVGVM